MKMHHKILSDIVAIFKNAFCPFPFEPIQGNVANVFNLYIPLISYKKVFIISMGKTNLGG